MILKSTSRHPENYILLGNVHERANDAGMIISEAKAHHPESFEGNSESFTFELRYFPPFDKDFRELKRLQGAAAKIAGRRSEFKGYITIDMSDWLTHHDEEYLNIALLFLADMNDYWKYIFVIDDHDPNASRKLVSKILMVFYHDHIPIVIRGSNEKRSDKDWVNTICKEQGIICSPQVKDLLQDLLTQDFSEDIISAILDEASLHLGNRIVLPTFYDLLSQQDSAIRYMLQPKEYIRLMNIIEQKKEVLYGGKETA